MKKSELKEIIREVLAEGTNLFLTRKQHDAALEKKPKLIKRLFDTYKTKWKLNGVIFFDVSQYDSQAVKPYIHEAKEDDALQSFKTNLENSINDIFPNGVVRVNITNGIIKVTSAMIGNKSDQESGSFDNDPAFTLFRGTIPKSDVSTTKFKIPQLRGGGVSVKNGERVKVGYRATATTLEGHVTSITKFYKKLAAAIIANKDMIRGDVPDKYFKIKK